MTVFTTIAFGLCAYLVQDFSYHKTMVYVGRIDNGVCDPFVSFPDTRGQTAMIEGHEYGVDVNNSGAVLHFDSKNFYFIKGSI